MAKQLKQTKLFDMFQPKTTQKRHVDCVPGTSDDAHNANINSDPSTDLVSNSVHVEASGSTFQEKCPIDLSPIDSKSPTMSSKSLRTFNFPKIATSNTKERRSFQCSWLDTFEWLEYSKCADAAFCFACRLYDIDGKKETTFTVAGFKNWKKASEKNAGFYKHEQTASHIKAMCAWKEKLVRDENSTTIVELLSDHVLAKRRTYIRAIIEVVIFLVENELALRGGWDSDLHQESGLFNRLFEFKLIDNAELRECQKVMPKNATYTSPIIQNEIISIIAKQVKQLIVNDVIAADVPCFTILADGTKDRCNKECVSIAARFVKCGRPKESLVSLETAKELDARSQANLILSTINTSGLNSKYLLSQCYDGANVMKGDEGGIQRIIQNILGRIIPYIHCLNHRLHLVIIAATDGIVIVKLFFDNIKLIYNFFRRTKIQAMYDGSRILNVIETRWAGHVRATRTVFENYGEVVNTLKNVKANVKRNFDGYDIALATGILSAIQKADFVFMLIFMKKFLGVIEPADKILQSKDVGFREAMPVIEMTVKNVMELRSTSYFNLTWAGCEEMLSATADKNAETRPIRDKRRSVKLDQSIITDTIGERSNDVKIELRSAHFEFLDIFSSEMQKRFHDNNDVLLAISEADQFDYEKLKPLQKIGLTLPPTEELSVAKSYIDRKKSEYDIKMKEQRSETFKERFPLLQTLYAMREAFPNVYQMMATVDTFACSTCICECSFSALERVGDKNRMNMTNQRLRDLTYLAFESKRLKDIIIDDVLKIFNNNPNRRIQLY